MSFQESKNAINDRLLELTKAIDQENEAARLQCGALAGALVGGWSIAASIEFGYSPLIGASILTIGVMAGLAARIML